MIAAYNCGPETINKAIRRSNGSKDYWQIYPYLPKETRGYVPAFIAANYIMNYYCEHNICPLTTRLPAKTDTVMINSNVHFEQIAAVVGMEKEQLRALNPRYRRDVIPGHTSPCYLRLPQSMVAQYLDHEQEINQYKTDSLLNKRIEVEVNDKAPAYVVKKGSHVRSRSVTVRPGQTLSEIARRNGTTVAKLKRLNGLKGTNIRAGKKLRVR